MRSIYFLSALFVLSPAYSNPTTLEFSPDAIKCYDSTWDKERGLHVIRNNGAYHLSFKNKEKPGRLKDYLAPLGVDPRIIANYSKWELISSVPEQNCEAKTFASKYPEELDCDASGTDFIIKAYYEEPDDRGRDRKLKEDIYRFENAKIKLQTKTEKLPHFAGAKPQDSLKFDLSYEFFGKNGKLYKVTAAPVYRVLEEHPTEGVRLEVEAECRLEALESLINIRLQQIILRRNK